MQEDFSAGCAYIDGRYVPIEQAGIPILDMGFSRSDCTYDVVSVWNGSFFRLADHLDRFERSCTCLRLNPGLARPELAGVLAECVARSGLRDAYVEMIATRGIPRSGERDPRRIVNRFYAYAIPYVWIARPEQQEAGLHVVIAEGVERISTRAVDPTVKNFHWGDLVRGVFEAFEREADTVVLLDAAGHVTEGPGFNLFASYRGQLLTPADGVLLGITRQTVLELAAREGVQARVGHLGPDILLEADEIFLTSTAGGVMPVTLLNGRAVGDGLPGALTRRLRDRYWEAHHDPAWSTPVAYGSGL